MAEKTLIIERLDETVKTETASVVIVRLNSARVVISTEPFSDTNKGVIYSAGEAAQFAPGSTIHLKQKDPRVKDVEVQILW